MSFAASRIIRFNNNVSLQNIIQRHLLRPSAVADSSVAQLLNKVSESRFSSPFTSENQNTLQAHSVDASNAMKKKNYSDRDVSMIMFAVSGINQYGNLKMNVRGRADIDEDDDGDDDADYDEFPTADGDSDDEGFGNSDGGFYDSEDPPYSEDEDIAAVRRSTRK